MGLFPEFSEKKTIKNVRNFFNNDKKYQKICRNAWMDGIKTQVNDATGTHGSHKGNGSEKMAIYYAECTRAKRAVERAINACSIENQDMLNWHYAKQLTVVGTKLYINHHLGHSTFDDADEVACLEFAEACDRILVQMNCNLEILLLSLNFDSDDEKAGTSQEQNGNRTGTKQEPFGNKTGSSRGYYCTAERITTPPRKINCSACILADVYRNLAC